MEKMSVELSNLLIDLRSQLKIINGYCPVKEGKAVGPCIVSKPYIDRISIVLGDDNPITALERRIEVLERKLLKKRRRQT